MSATETPNQVVFCNNCGTANPRHAAICCNCEHVHARIMDVPVEAQPTIVIEKWFWIALRAACGLALCIARMVPKSGTSIVRQSCKATSNIVIPRSHCSKVRCLVTE
jgi:hypothetical protein